MYYEINKINNFNKKKVFVDVECVTTQLLYNITLDFVTNDIETSNNKKKTKTEWYIVTTPIIIWHKYIISFETVLYTIKHIIFIVFTGLAMDKMQLSLTNFYCNIVIYAQEIKVNYNNI